MCETLSELLLLLLLRLFPLSFTKTEGKRLALLEQSAAGEISLELVPHGGQKVELLSPSSTGNNFSHLRTLFPSPLKKKGNLGGHGVQIICQISRNGRNWLSRPCVLWQLRDDSSRPCAAGDNSVLSG